MNRQLRDMLMDRLSDNSYSYKRDMARDMARDSRRDMRRDMYSKPIEEDYYNVYDYRGRRRDEYMDRRDMRMDRDYYERDEHSKKEPVYLTEEDMMNWKECIGVKFSEQQLKPYYEKERINFHDNEKDYTEKEMCMTVNMLYSDYREVLGEDIAKYVKMAKLFLEDKDSKFKGGEKLAMYYHIFAPSD